MREGARAVLVDLEGEERWGAVAVVKDSFVGIYRWHAKRTLRDALAVRAAELDGTIAGVSMLEELTPEVGYVFYIAVAREHRRKGIGGRLLDDALARFRRDGIRIVYSAAEKGNLSSIELLRSRGFRIVERREPSYREGGLGAWGLRSRMRLVHGEVLLGRRVDPPGPGSEGARTDPGPAAPDPASGKAGPTRSTS